MENNKCQFIFENFTQPINETATISYHILLEQKLGPQRKDVIYVILLSFLYGLIFISGIVGNICTCFVILKNNSLRTTTNYYLLSLAVSDVLILLLGLPPEAYLIYEEYPWRFGYVYCIIKALFAEMTSYASVLTITAFTVERYIAICHPLKAHKIATFSRCIKIIISIWLISLVCALPYPIHTDLFYYVHDRNKNPVPDSLICNIPNQYYERMMHVFQISTFLFFVLPLTVLIVLYSLIGLKLRKVDLRRAASEECRHSTYGQRHSGSISPGNFRHRTESHGSRSEGSPSNMPRKVVLKLLVAVVAAFFICWAPFHAQRLLTVYNRNWTPILLQVQGSLFYISGILYFIGSTVNPILYNVMSRRFRRAFSKTICRSPCEKRESHGHNSCKQQREWESKLHPVEHRDFESNHRSYIPKQNAMSRNIDKCDGLNTSVCDKETLNGAVEYISKSTHQQYFTYKPNICNDGSRQPSKILHMAIMTETNKSSGLGVYV